MGEIKCPMCRGTGVVECDLCLGSGKIFILKRDDKVGVEVLNKGTEFEYVLLHQHTKKSKVIDEVLTLEEVFKKYKDVRFCDYCFGKYIIYENKILRAY